MNVIEKEMFLQMHRALKAAADCIIFMDRSVSNQTFALLKEIEKLDNLMKPVTITTEMVADLREITGEGFMSCKKALIMARGDQQKAVAYLRAGNISNI